MEVTSNNLCESCTNTGCEFQSGIVRTECAFYMPPQLEPDNCGNYVVIPKAEYETRLKADTVAILMDIQLEIEELRLGRPLISRGYECYGFENKTPAEIKQECSDIIQQKINALRGRENEKCN